MCLARRLNILAVQYNPHYRLLVYREATSAAQLTNTTNTTNMMLAAPCPIALSSDPFLDNSPRSSSSLCFPTQVSNRDASTRLRNPVLTSSPSYPRRALLASRTRPLVSSPPSVLLSPVSGPRHW